jgi:hypothetical protein
MGRGFLSKPFPDCASLKEVMMNLSRTGTICLLSTPLLSFSAINRYVDCCSTSASDSNNGSYSSPYKTLAKAASMLNAGDTCFIKGGTYRETLVPRNPGTATAPIVYKTFGSQIVTLSGTDPVTASWSNQGANLYVRTFPAGTAPGRIYQVFMDGKPMAENTWPKVNAAFSTSQFRLIPNGAATRVGPQRWCLSDPAIPKLGENNYWNGAHIWALFGVKTTAHIRTIDQHDNGRICFDTWSGDYRYFPDGTGGYASYYLIIKRPQDQSLLEAGQWSYDPGQGKLSLRFAAGDAPSNHTIEVRTRLTGISLQSAQPLSHVHFSDISLFAASIDFGNSSSCKVSNTHLRYLAPFFYTIPSGSSFMVPPNFPDLEWRGINLTGQNNSFSNSIVDGSWADGLSVYGTGNTAKDNVISNTNWIAGDFAGISLGGNGNQAIRNKIFSVGRSGIVHRGAKAAKISFNRIFDFGKLVDDFGGTYTWGDDGQGTEISYNWIGPDANQSGKYPSEIQCSATNPASHCPRVSGIYLDDDDANYVVQNNVVYGGNYPMRLNGTQTNVKILHNTLIGGWKSIASTACQATSMVNVEIKNNVLQKGFEVSDADCGMNWTLNIDKSGNIENQYQDGYFAAPANGLDFRLSTVSPLPYLNAGVTLPDCRQVSGITTCLYSNPEGRGPVQGGAPDVGAYERRPDLACVSPACLSPWLKNEWKPGPVAKVGNKSKPPTPLPE